jgi:hypothetical protein
MWVGQHAVKSIVRSVTRAGHDDTQLTCQITASIDELDNIIIFVSNDVMILGKEK